MTEAIKLSWQGSTVPDDFSGEAKFQVGDASVKVKLPYFSDAHALDLLLRNAYELGQCVGISKVKAAVAGVRP